MLALPVSLLGQEKEKPKFVVKIDQVRVGFRPYAITDSGQFKVGMWTPVYVEVTAGAKGVLDKNPGDPVERRPHLRIETPDSEGVGTIYRMPIALEPNETRTFVAYVKPGNLSDAARLDISLHYDDRTYGVQQQVGSPIPRFGSQLYLTLGSRVPDLRDALVSLVPRNQGGNPQFVPEPDARDTGLRVALFENDPHKLPDLWFGYQGIDLMILGTDKKEFLSALTNKRPLVEALSAWVRRGGRLVIPVNHQNQDFLAQLLQSPAWQPALPVMPPANPGDVKQNAVAHLPQIQNWAGAALDHRFPPLGSPPVPIAKLDPRNVPEGAWDVQEKTEDGRTLIARMPYGLGSITYLAFSLDQPPFTRWDGRVQFLMTLCRKLAPRINERDDLIQDRFMRGEQREADLATSLHGTLDNFDVNVIPFGYVALFIILYILIVGPLDYFILKHVFKRLEWTWITFPAVVVAVSVAAYYTAYALKGNDLKINKIDVIDFDLRTEVDEKEKPRRAFACGQTFFTILSPHIENYTVGVEVNPAFWGGKTEKPISADLVSWLGRPENDGFGAMGGARSQGFFRRAYSYGDEAKGLRGVPIPVWTTKAFTASWDAVLQQAPVEAELAYHVRPVGGRDVKLSGTIKNQLGVDLEDVWLIYDNRCFLAPGLKAGAEPVTLELETSTLDLNGWSQRPETGQRDAGFRSAQGNYNPTSLVKQVLFFEKIDTQNNTRNSSLRTLDLSWRIKAEHERGPDLREAILYARVRFQRGLAEPITAGNTAPTNLWLGRLPVPGETRRRLDGQLAQDTYVRILLPVKRSEKN